ncbi:hypothetical protein B0H16DRAFT_1713785 [Mycena metata]|uniref:Uncharacterized protein n=1 Tax=Mycena metata TaxID=1033252 RepID=A0AAD7NTJ6_9AGAR|nr:hypothetical protein B0H16DRAFT_1713785 [Mycena metata]
MTAADLFWAIAAHGSTVTASEYLLDKCLIAFSETLRNARVEWATADEELHEESDMYSLRASDADSGLSTPVHRGRRVRTGAWQDQPQTFIPGASPLGLVLPSELDAPYLTIQF